MTVRQNLIGLLEDDPDQAALFRLWLESHGYATRLYPQAGEFRRKLGAESVDLLLLDWNLPDESGIEVLRALRASGVRLRRAVAMVCAAARILSISGGLLIAADNADRGLRSDVRHHPTRRDKPSRASRDVPALPPTALRSGEPPAA